ncbi:hypothetical protein Mpet_0314 [Methanolacinia petrolearia DSM 11571]|uniref:Uncharacterized protein n=1 Tax=Methanolacinia petrolearia (strain DSM 11571 / OCM 486 / SEBR 4847) TaxID=679926 RepID=E1RFT6_METP4|nr:hypothetical protein [Methanolacinia petrolearia]ADN35088.1 hypothetical protein Mpet_0314 [Methanolacinia petrolearia DSM 11571]
MKEILVLWSHADDPAIPPLVCPDTCRTVKEVVIDFQNARGTDKCRITFSEEILKGKKGNDSSLTIDGLPLEELVPLPDPSKYCGMACEGCGTGKKGEERSCSRIYEQIPESVLRLALSKALEKRITG